MDGNANDFIFLRAGGPQEFAREKRGLSESTWNICTGWLVIQTYPHMRVDRENKAFSCCSALCLTPCRAGQKKLLRLPCRLD
jgi:hypothetical protein